MHYLRRDRIRVYPRARWLPFLLLWWALLGVAWLSVWTAVWCWEACGPAAAKSASTTSRIFGWTR